MSVSQFDSIFLSSSGEDSSRNRDTDDWTNIDNLTGRKLYLTEEELQKVIEEFSVTGNGSYDEIFEYENGIKCTLVTQLKPIGLEDLIKSGPTGNFQCQSARINVKNKKTKGIPRELIPVLKQIKSSLLNIH